MLPLAAPQSSGFVIAISSIDGCIGASIVTSNGSDKQVPLDPATVTEYVPGMRSVNSSEAKKSTPLILNVKGATPPTTEIELIAPSLTPHSEASVVNTSCITGTSGSMSIKFISSRIHELSVYWMTIL